MTSRPTTVERIEGREPVTRLRWIVRYGSLAGIVVGIIGLGLIALLNPFAEGANWGRDEGFWAFPLIAAVVYLVPGIIVLFRSDWHPVGWLLCNLAIGFNFSFAPELSADTALGGWWIWLTYISTSVVFWGVWSGLILVFPDRISERAPARRRLPWTVLAVNAVCVVLISFQDRIAVTEGSIPSPMPFTFVPERIGSQIYIITLLMLPVVLFDFVRRYRRAKPAERPQYRWVVWAFLYVGITLAIGIVTTLVTGNEDSSIWVLVVLGYILVPVAFMVSILRFRLYSIDKVVSRTLTYGVVAVLVGVIYTVPVVVLADALGGSNDIVIAASTLAAAAAFSPIRRWAQRIIDRRFNRAKYDAEREVAAFGARLQSETDFTDINGSLLKVLHATVQPSTAALWLREESDHD